MILRTLRRLSGILATFTLIACSSGDSDSMSQFSEGPYAGDDMWLCKPGMNDDQCLGVDQTTLHVDSAGNFDTREHEAVVNASFNCFYVYPTVDQREEPGNTEDLTDIEPILRPLINQAARFTGLCNVYAPLYHQMTIGTYGVPGGFTSSEFYDRAFADVDEAFSQFLAETGDTPFVLMGHSQGSHMLIRLIQERIDNNSALRSRMISALLSGPVGALEVPAGGIVGGSFANIPLCTAAGETTCAIAFDSIAAGNAANRPARNIPCVNPTVLGGTPGVFASTIWQASNGLPYPFDTPVPWVSYDGVYTAECEADGFLGIAEMPTGTQPPVPSATLQALLGTSLHVADVSLAMGDLLRIVETQAAAF